MSPLTGIFGLGNTGKQGGFSPVVVCVATKILKPVAVFSYFVKKTILEKEKTQRETEVKGIENILGTFKFLN